MELRGKFPENVINGHYVSESDANILKMNINECSSKECDIIPHDATLIP